MAKANKAASADPVVMLPLNKIFQDKEDNISGNRHSKRDVEQMAESIKQFREIAPHTAGLMNPLVVKPLPVEEGTVLGDLPTHKLASGNKRFEALGVVYMDTPDVMVPVVIVEFDAETDKRQTQFLNLDENVTQTGMTAWDLSCAAHKMVEEGVKRDEIARRIGKTVPYISYILSFQKLREGIQKKIHEGAIPFRLARVLATLDEAEQDKRIADIEAGSGASETADKAVNKRGKSKRGRKAKHETETGGEKKGLSAKKAVMLLVEAVGKVQEKEKPTKGELATVNVFSLFGKFLEGKMGIAALTKKVYELV